jgi:poly(A) polymerase
MSLLEKIDPDLLAGALHVCQTLQNAGFVALLAGGAVRDLLLDRPVFEIDIASSAPPEKVQRLFPRTVAVGKQFGVIVVVHGNQQYEVTTFRRESGYLDGRHPTEIHFTDAEEDARRRDFTVNSFFLDPFTEELIDFAGGEADLRGRLIRTVGDPAERFREDKLRIMRAVRFACQLGFEIEAETFRHMQLSASGLTQVSWERIRDELLKVLAGPDPARGLVLLDESGILPVILPEVAAMKGVEQPPEFHPEGDVFEHTRLMLSLAGRLDDVLAMAILLHDVGKPPTFTVKERIRFDGHAELGAEMAEEICRRLRLPTDQSEEIVDLVLNHLRFIPVQEMRESTLKRFLRKDNFHKHLELHRLDCLASHGDLSSYHFCRRKLEEFTLESLLPKPLIGGRDLIELGFQPGPLFSEILGSVEDLQLEGRLGTPEEALEWVRRHYPKRQPR